MTCCNNRKRQTETDPRGACDAPGFCQLAWRHNAVYLRWTGPTQFNDSRRAGATAFSCVLARCLIRTRGGHGPQPSHEVVNFERAQAYSEHMVDKTDVANGTEAGSCMQGVWKLLVRRDRGSLSNCLHCRPSVGADGHDQQVVL